MPVLSSIEGLSSSMLSCMFIQLPVQKADLSGQTIIVSGSNQGLGFEASRQFLHLGVSRLIMACRNIEKAEAARLELLKSTGRDDSTIEVWELDMDNYASVKSLATRAKTLPRLDAILANAGLATEKFSLAEENEKTITVNVVSTFLLIMLLIPKLRESAKKFSIMPRVSIVNSALHYMAPLNEIEEDHGKGIFDRLNNEETAQMSLRYPLSKLLVLFGVRALADRLERSEEPLVILNSPNPSWCKSQLMRENDSLGMRWGEKLIARPTEMGSRALVHGILSGMAVSVNSLVLPNRPLLTRFGQYLDNCQVKRPSCIVTNQKGAAIEKAFFEELIEKIEYISPGTTSDLFTPKFQ